MRIKQLPTLIINQIAAGEAIERPASVVKELLENALDAKADKIHIEIYYGGLNQIKISDNGHGIYSEDLPLAIASHATSKIVEFGDLYAIKSMGFRGEALASIASIAKLAIISKPNAQNHAMKLVMEAGDHFRLEPCARQSGTTVDVQDLFFNVPVRKKFLKTERLEFQAIEAIVKRFALSAPSIAIDFSHNGKKILQLNSAQSEKNQLNRIQKILGQSFLDNSRYVEIEHPETKLFGWVGEPNYQRSQNDKQWIYVNGRIIKDKLLNHAIKQGYESVLQPGRFPVCLLYLFIKPEEVDVNVHPTKHEVRFHQARWVHDLISSTIKQVVKSSSIPSNVKSLSSQRSLFDVQDSWAKKSQASIANGMNSEHKICEPSVAFNFNKSVEEPIFSSTTIANSQWINLNEGFILIFLDNTPFLVDGLILQRQYLSTLLNKKIFPLESRQMLVPITYKLPAGTGKNFNVYESILNQIGVHFTWATEETLVIRTLPILVPHLDLKPVFNTLLKQSTEELEPIQLILQHQFFNPHYATQQEKENLMYYFSELVQKEETLNSKEGWWKQLSTELCRNLLYA